MTQLTLLKTDEGDGWVRFQAHLPGTQLFEKGLRVPSTDIRWNELEALEWVCETLIANRNRRPTAIVGNLHIMWTDVWPTLPNPRSNWKEKKVYKLLSDAFATVVSHEGGLDFEEPKEFDTQLQVCLKTVAGGHRVTVNGRMVTWLPDDPVMGVAFRRLLDASENFINFINQ